MKAIIAAAISAFVGIPIWVGWQVESKKEVPRDH